ncbi:hypothetical protein Goshw_008398 [Gossypium schwendimanii]|uniref:Uncharacterized protein n=1 Tax=Gossypium schwendimanii TaxID=34291 RepID=A0A7J9LER5_GOSSC|nr:hypothetical protein [Gossypium schwendimanii]
MASRLFATAAEKIEPAELRRQALSLTQAAAPRIRHLLQQLNRLFLDWVLRLAAATAYSAPSVTPVRLIFNEKGKFDEFVEDKGVKIPIDPKALMHVIGTKMVFEDDKLRSLTLGRLVGKDIFLTIVMDTVVLTVQHMREELKRLKIPLPGICVGIIFLTILTAWLILSVIVSFVSNNSFLQRLLTIAILPTLHPPPLCILLAVAQSAFMDIGSCGKKIISVSRSLTEFCNYLGCCT